MRKRGQDREGRRGLTFSKYPLLISSSVSMGTICSIINQKEAELMGRALAWHVTLVLILSTAGKDYKPK